MASMVESGAHVRRGLYLVFALTLVGADGCPVHAEPRLLRVDFDSRLFRGSRRPTPRQVQDIVSALAIPPDAVVPSLVRQGGHDRLDVIALVEGRRRERRRKREAAIVDVVAGGYPSAARLLVQAGLFDRRSLRAAAIGAASTAARQDDMSERVARVADVPLEQKIRLVAALLVASGR
jgi:hypothetical protein